MVATTEWYGIELIIIHVVSFVYNPIDKKSTKQLL